MDDGQRSMRYALVAALAGEHRLRRQALREQQEVDRWLQRAAFATERGLVDLAASARTRSERHARMAQLLQQQAEALHAEVERLRSLVEAGREVSRAPPLPTGPSLESRFAALELEQELEQISRSRRAHGSGASEPHG